MRPEAGLEGPRIRRGVAVGAGFTVLSLLVHIPGFVVRLFTSDEATVATIARELDSGARLYVDVADRKPPLVPYLYAFVFRVTGTVDLRPVRLVGAVVLAATAAVLASEAARRYGSARVGVACGVLFLLAYAAFYPGDSQAATFELFMLLPMTAAVVAAARSRWLAAGLLLGVACLCKQTAATGLLPVAYLVVKQRGWPRATLAVLVTAATVTLGGVLVGLSGFWLWNVSGNGGYLAYQGSPAGTMLRGLAMTAAVVITEVPLLTLCVLSAARRRSSVDLWLWLAAGGVSVFAGLRFFGHYYLHLLPPLALTAAGAFPILAARARRLILGGAAMFAATMTAVAFVPLGDNASIPWPTIASAVRDAASPGDSVFVWGDLPEIYVAADRRPATRFVRTSFLTGTSGGRANGSGQAVDGIPGAWSMLGSDLQRHPPDLIVDTSSTPIRQANYYPLARTPIGAYVAANFHLIETVEGVRLLRADNPRIGGMGPDEHASPGMVAGSRTTDVSPSSPSDPRHHSRTASAPSKRPSGVTSTAQSA